MFECVLHATRRLFRRCLIMKTKGSIIHLKLSTWEATNRKLGVGQLTRAISGDTRSGSEDTSVASRCCALHGNCGSSGPSGPSGLVEESLVQIPPIFIERLLTRLVEHKVRDLYETGPLPIPSTTILP